MIRSIKGKKYFVSFLVTKSHRSNFLHLYISWYFMKIKNKSQLKQFYFPCVVWTGHIFFFLFLVFWPVAPWTECIIQLGKHEFVWLRSYVGERESGRCVSSFLKVWVRKSTTQPCLLDFAFSVENTGSDDSKGVCGCCWLTSLQFLWKDDLIGTTVTLF